MEKAITPGTFEYRQHALDTRTYLITTPRLGNKRTGRFRMNEVSKVGRVLISPSVRLAQSQDGAVLLDVDQGQCFSINSIGAVIWNYLNQDREIDQIAKSLVEQFHIPLTDATTHVQEFVLQLKQMQLVRDSEDPTPVIQSHKRTIDAWTAIWNWIRRVCNSSLR